MHLSPHEEIPAAIVGACVLYRRLEPRRRLVWSPAKQAPWPLRLVALLALAKGIRAALAGLIGLLGRVTPALHRVAPWRDDDLLRAPIALIATVFLFAAGEALLARRHRALGLTVAAAIAGLGFGWLPEIRSGFVSHFSAGDAFVAIECVAIVAAGAWVHTHRARA